MTSITSTLDAALGEARRSTGLSDFGPADFIEPLRVYLDLQDKVPLLPAAREQLDAYIQRCLVNRLRFARDVKSHPEILDEDVSDPIVVLGFPRSGTTVLQRMIAADPAMQNLALWRVLNPAPLPNEVAGEPTERLAIARATEEAVRTHNPALFAAHPMIADDAEEDWFLHHLTFQHVGNVFWCLQSSEYLDYLRTLPRLPGYRYVANLLRYLQWQDGGKRRRKWVLKSPVHIGCIDEILEVHPDATFIYPQREFTTVVASFCHALEASVATSGSSFITPHEIGQLTVNYWTAELERFEQSRRRLGNRLNLMKIHYQELLSDPVRHLYEVYARAGTQLDSHGEQAIRRWLADNPAGKHGKNVYKLERYGLTAATVSDTFARFE